VKARVPPQPGLAPLELLRDVEDCLQRADMLVGELRERGAACMPDVSCRVACLLAELEVPGHAPRLNPARSHAAVGQVLTRCEHWLRDYARKFPDPGSGPRKVPLETRQVLLAGPPLPGRDG